MGGGGSGTASQQESYRLTSQGVNFGSLNYLSENNKYLKEMVIILYLIIYFMLEIITKNYCIKTAY